MNDARNALDIPPAHVLRDAVEQQSLIRRETEHYLAGLCAEYPRRSAQKRWNTSSEAAYLASAEDARAAWHRALGVQDFSAAQPLHAEVLPFMEDENIVARQVFIPLAGPFRAHAIFATSKKFDGNRPLLVCQHGIGGDTQRVSGAARVMGFGDDTGHYKDFARRAVEQGFAVLAPHLITTAAVRARLHRLCVLMGFTLCGLEIGKIRRLVDWASAQPGVDSERIGMWGLSMGGQYALFTPPVEPRIKAAICSGFFNHRVNKMVFENPRWSSFLTSPNEDVFIPGFLNQFSDADLVALICPRPFAVQCGKSDSVSWWPDVMEEFERAKMPYEALGIGGRLELCLHEGGHEIRLAEGLDFFKRRLMATA